MAWFVLNTDNIWYGQLMLLHTMSVKRDGKEEPVDTECAWYEWTALADREAACDCISATRIERLALKPKGGLTCARLTGWCLLLLALVIRWVPPSQSLPSPWPS